MATRYEVVILNEQLRVDSTMVTGPKSVSQFSEKVARRHAREFSAKWNKRAVAIPVGAHVVVLLRERIEVPHVRNGRPGYRWTEGYYVVDHLRGTIHTPVRRNEAFDLARQLFGADCKIIIGD